MSPDPLMVRWNHAEFDEVPELAALVPPDASLWTTEFVTAWFSARPYLKSLPHELNDPYFSGLCFTPDYVILEHGFPRIASPELRDRLLTFFAVEGYTKEAEYLQLVLLKHPRAPLARGGGPPPAFVLPPAAPMAAVYGAYLEGNNHINESVALLMRAANEGETGPMMLLARAYGKGEGVPQDLQEAERWLLRADDAQEATAAGKLAAVYQATKRFDEAAVWARKAADRGDGESQDRLGLFYMRGLGVPQDKAEAARRFKAAVAAGYVQGGNDLGMFYMDAGDAPRACEEFRRAADAGYPRGQYNLGLCYARGSGLAKNDVEAHRWWRKAADGGDHDAAVLLSNLGVRR
jgi:TPR repeat protein